MIRPIIGITMGDPAGIGPEIIVKSLLDSKVYEKCRPLVIGDSRVIQQALHLINSDLALTICSVRTPLDGKYISGVIDVLDLKNISPEEYSFGRVQGKCGLVAGESIRTAIELALTKKISAIVTSPIAKDAFKIGGFQYAGHTEMFGELTGTKDYRMVLMHEKLSVIHNSTHVSLRQAIDLVRKDRILKTITLGNEFAIEMGIKNPRIAVCGLNPHCGENQMFGSEEIDEIVPAIEVALKSGINVISRTVPADTAFAKAEIFGYDLVVAMYHDQGHIPVKLKSFQWDGKTEEVSVRGINTTVGIPIIRTSVDHGVAFGKAGKGIADHSSLLDALNLAILLACSRDSKNTTKVNAGI
ncbi:MAG: 4-hydroxythreonine-4-phosphate dehydrogenase PdxA [Oligoflexia bacterium]|nr:4-hydroxythreonine-4-phosphate dehydrogenase PdxA [Oligoflexia bacterium]